ncbi:MAG: hypothetical protein KDK89_08645 [Alphaproteobacteria bacterium]|nr:hypothetical protein [Alphaproteobacteria bacterium]
MRRSLAVVLMCASPALAEGPSKEATAIFPHGVEACYAAEVAAGASTPGTTVTAFHLYHLFDPNPATESVGFTRDEAMAFDKATADTDPWATVAVRFADQAHPFTNVVTCSEWESIPGRVICGVECDGGYFAVARTGGGLAMTFPPDSGGLSLNASCGEPDDDGADRWLKPEEIGTGLTLKTADVADCRAAEQAVRKAYRGDPVSLRERIETKGWRCLARHYDKSHLAKHPQQMVTAMAVAIKGPVVVDRSLGNYNHTHLEVKLSYRLRDGQVRTTESSCGAGDYEYSCEGGFRLRRRDESSALLAAGEFDDPEGGAPVMLDTRLGAGDRLFRLDASAGTSCALD